MNITELNKNFRSINELHKNLVAQAKARRTELNSELSKCDLMLTDAVHYLEIEKCDAVDMVITAKIIKQIRQDRRKIKIEIDQINCLLQYDGQKDISAYEVEKTYKYRTQIMNDLNQRNGRIDK